jgi:hypothetical protein
VSVARPFRAIPLGAICLCLVACGGGSASPPADTGDAESVPEGGVSGDGGSSEGGALDAAPDADAGSPSDGATDADAQADPAGTFVAVGYGGRRMRSTDDGQSWTDDQSLEANGGDDQELLRTVAFGQGMFLAAGWQTLSSPDGKTWTALAATHQNWFGSLVYEQSLWVAVGGYGMRLTSPDALTWTDHSIDTVAAHPHGCLTFAPGNPHAYVACNDNGVRSYSPDGTQWTVSTGAANVTSSQLAFGNGKVVGIDGANVVTSTDAGHTWTMAATLMTAGGGLVFAQGHFTYLATGAVFTSIDGVTWMQHQAAGISPSALAYGHGTYVAVRPHEWQRSTDGVTWSPAQKDASTDNAFEWVTFGATK